MSYWGKDERGAEGVRTSKLTGADEALLVRYGLAEEEPARLRHVDYEKGEYLVRFGEPLQQLLILARGRAKVMLSLPSGQAVLAGIYDGQGILGDIEIFTGSAMSTHVVAATPVACISIPVALWQGRLQHSPPFLRYLATSLAHKLARSSTNSTVNLLIPLEARLCAYIGMTAQGGVFEANLTEVADLLGSSYRHLMRVLKALCDGGVLGRQKGSYRVLDTAALADRAGDTTFTREEGFSQWPGRL